MVGGPVIDKWVKIWFSLLGKTEFNVQEAERLNLGIRLANNPLKVHVKWKGNQLIAATITEAWVGSREVFGELWMKNTIMTYIDTGKETEDSESQTLLTPTKKFWFKEGESVLKVSKHSRWKETESSQAYFKPRYNVKPKNNSGVFRNMVFKTYLQLSLPIAIQQINEYGATEIKTQESITVIWKVLTSIDSKSVILAWYPKVEEILCPLKTLDYVKTLTKRQ